MGPRSSTIAGGLPPGNLIAGGIPPSDSEWMLDSSETATSSTHPGSRAPSEHVWSGNWSAAGGTRARGMRGDREGTTGGSKRCGEQPEMQYVDPWPDAATPNGCRGTTTPQTDLRSWNGRPLGAAITTRPPSAGIALALPWKVDDREMDEEPDNTWRSDHRREYGEGKGG